MASERLPGKPLLDIAGIPMIVRVAQTCIESLGVEAVTVSTPDDEIALACESHGIDVHRSSLSCVSGTDRLAEFAATYPSLEPFVNVQGDEPMLTPEVLNMFLSQLGTSGDTVVGISQMRDPSLVASESTVKVATSGGSLIYASRSPLPAQDKSGDIIYWKHTGLYSFSSAALQVFSENSRGPLELSENVEILRLVENGIPVRVAEVPPFGRAVDTERDLEFVRAHFSEKES